MCLVSLITKETTLYYVITHFYWEILKTCFTDEKYKRELRQTKYSIYNTFKETPSHFFEFEAFFLVVSFKIKDLKQGLKELTACAFLKL